MSYGMEWWQMAVLLAFGIFCLTIFKWAWNYKSKSQKWEEKRMKGSKWERSHYNTVLLPKARWEEPPDNEVWRN
jgi:hypothetical protein